MMKKYPITTKTNQATPLRNYPLYNCPNPGTIRLRTKATIGLHLFTPPPPTPPAFAFAVFALTLDVTLVKLMTGAAAGIM